MRGEDEGVTRSERFSETLGGREMNGVECCQSDRQMSARSQENRIVDRRNERVVEHVVDFCCLCRVLLCGELVVVNAAIEGSVALDAQKRAGQNDFDTRPLGERSRLIQHDAKNNR